MRLLFAGLRLVWSTPWLTRMSTADSHHPRPSRDNACTGLFAEKVPGAFLDMGYKGTIPCSHPKTLKIDQPSSVKGFLSPRSEV